MRFFRRHRTALASGTVLSVGAAVLVAYAMSADGYRVSHVDLNDGGIWVTSDRDGLFGRLNKPAGTLDAAFYPPGGAQQKYQLDIAQDAAAVVARDQAAGKLFPVDVTMARTLPDQGVPIPPTGQVQLAGGTLAVLDVKSGKVWAKRVDLEHGVGSLAELDSASPPVASVDGGDAPDSAALAVGVDGTVHAVSSSGKVASVRPNGTGFGDAEYARLPQPVRAVRASAVGGRLVVLDPSSGTVLLPGGKSASAGGEAAVLQQPGPDNASVVVATKKSLQVIDLLSGTATSLSEAGAGAPAAPVRLGDCVHAAWAGADGGYVRSCGGKPATPGNVKDIKALVQPTFRVNRGSIVLNDLASGAVWDLSNQRKVDDWSAVKPPPVDKPSDKSKDNESTRSAQDKPPKAVDDTLGARPGRTTVLHVLDNDSDPSGNILAISAVTGLDDAKAALAVAPDGQTVEITLPPGGTDVHFKYTVDDGKGLNATASVTVQSRPAGQNKPPETRPGYQAGSYTIPSAGRLSLPVLADWRDFDGDPVVLVDANVKAGTVSTTPAGFVDYLAPATAGTQTVSYQASDGLSEPVPGTAEVVVQKADATTAVAAVAQPDVARGQTGQPITVRPLDNDVPGSDPVNPSAKLQIAGEIPSPAGTAVSTDLRTGIVTVTGTKPGTYFLGYRAAFGNAPFAEGAIRVDVVAAPPTPAPPVAMPDTAVLHGQAPSIVDVLANDFDPAGSLLVVQHAAVVPEGAPVQVAIAHGHWLRINALAPQLGPEPPVVRYTITDGITGPVTGEVAVTQLPAPAADTPVPREDAATVRAGDSVLIPVLDNDTTPGGSPISLAANVKSAPAPGRLTITSTQGADAGNAYVAGSVVRYVAPATVDTPRKVTIDYVAENPAGDQAVGHAVVTINPAPTPTTPDQPPAPQPVEARAVAGDTIVLTVPTTGVDPDGDTVSVIGINSASALGRVTGMNATSITYQAYPTSSGTDSVRYLVVDRYGKTGESTIRVAVVPPGQPQPPVAVDDVLTAAPGARLRVDVLANDLRAPDDAVTVEPLAERNPGLPQGITLTDGMIEATAPDLTGKPLVVVYAVTDGIGEPSVGSLTVRSQENYDVPPVCVDAFAQPEPKAGTVEIDVLAKCGDQDGGALSVSQVFGPDTQVAGGKITVPVLDQPRTVAYEVTDAGGATGLGFVHVPAPGSGAPYAKPGQTIAMDKGASKTVSVADYVIDPAGKQVKLTLKERIWASPSAGLKVENKETSQLVLTALGDYAGPAAITFEVTDGSSITDPEGRSAVITVPVQVGPETPVLRCPNDPLPLVEGGAPATVDVTSVCHVWMPDRAKLAGLRYSASWQNRPDGVTLDGSGNHTITLAAGGSAKPGATGVVSIGVEGTEAVASRLGVAVTAARLPSVAAITVDGVKAGSTADVNITPYVRSQLRDPAISVVSVNQSGGMPATSTSDGPTVHITPSAEAHGTITFAIVVTDVADASRTDRRASGQITVHVLGVPDIPGTPVPGRTVLSRSVELSWSAPANNGAPIDSYEVAYNGGKQTCPASPCTITGLRNGTDYGFTVKAHNLVGWSKPSGSASAQPNTVPGAVTGLATSNPQDGTLQLSWGQPPNDGTPVLRYEMTWTGGGHASSTGTGTTATGLDNDTQYTFTVIAVNSQGPGPAATVAGQSAGAPDAPAAPTFTSADSADSASRAVRVSWAAVDPNGWSPATYTLTRSGAGTKTVCTAVTATTCPDDGLANDGTIYTYTVTAANGAPGAGHTSPPSPGAQMEATATPDPITGFSAVPTGSDGQARLTFNAPASHGKTSTISCTYNGGSCGTWTYPTGGQSGATQVINGLPNGAAQTVTLKDCNGSGGGAYAGNPCDAPVSANVTTYGPLRNLNIATSANGPTVNFTVSVDPNGKPATVQIQTSRQSQTFTTGVGGWSWSGADNMGYSATDTINVTVSDPGRASLSQSRSQATPPPPPTVTVTKGRACSSGTACYSSGTCTHPSCAYIHVQTANFPGPVTCSFNSQDGNGGFVNTGYGANESKDSNDWFGYPGHWVTATCGGVVGQMTWY